MKRIYPFTFVLLSLILLSFAAQAQQTAEKMVVTTDYYLYHPQGYDADTVRQWPLVLFLHGAGESGNDLEKIKVHGLPKLIDQGRQFPFIIVSPQSKGWGWKPDDLYRLLNQVMGNNRVDRDRVYVTGLSMGGFGTWALAKKYPEMFAAIIPICGGGDTTDISVLRNMGVWCFHGALDDVVPIENSTRMVDALRQYKPDVKYTIYPEAYHDSWTTTYENDSIYSWLLEHKRFPSVGSR